MQIPSRRAEFHPFTRKAETSVNSDSRRLLSRETSFISMLRIALTDKTFFHASGKLFLSEREGNLKRSGSAFITIL